MHLPFLSRISQRSIISKSIKILTYLFIGQLLYIAVLRWVDPPITFTQLSNWLSGYGLKRNYVAYKDISPYLKLAAIAAEDQAFPMHWGFDWENIKKVYKQNQHGRRIKGASTISQQVAKNVFLWQGRSWIRKGIEVYFTFMIELLWSKKRILEVYLNVIEMGKGIFGAEAATQYYFKKSAARLTPEESVRIVACFPSPKKRSPNKVSPYMSKQTAWILQNMRNLRSDAKIAELINQK